MRRFWNLILLLKIALMSLNISAFHFDDLQFGKDNTGEIKIKNIRTFTKKEGFRDLLIFTPPAGQIEVVGIIDGDRSCSLSWNIRSLDDLHRAFKNDRTTFGIVMLGALTKMDKKLLMDEAIYSAFCATLRRAQIITFNGTVYYVNSDWEQFEQTFKEKITQ